MKRKLFSVLKYCLFLGLGIFLVWWSIHKMDDKNWADCKEALKSARYILFVPVFFIISASHLSRAMRWKILMKPMGYNPKLLNTFFAVMVGYLANLAIPRLGEVLKCTILGRYEKVPADKLVGTILIERVMDVICLVTVFVIALISQADIIGEFASATLKENFFSGGTKAVVIKFSIILGSLLLLYFIFKYIFRIFSQYLVIKRIKQVFTGVSTGISSIKNLQNKTAFILHTIFIWSCYIGGTYLGFFATKGTDHLPFAAVFPVLAFASIGMIITPGGIGTYPRFIMQVMLLYNIEEGLGYANGTLQWVAQSFIILVVGFISLLVLPYYNREKRVLEKSDAAPSSPNIM
jgi:glycosyltransferase 2 family protein